MTNRTMQTAENHEEALPTVPSAFSIHDDASANWLVRRVVESRNYSEHVKTWSEHELRQAKKDEDFFLSRYGYQLNDWLRHRLKDQKGRRRSVPLPGGTVGYRCQPPKLVVIDEQAVVLWAQSTCPQAIETVTNHRLRRRILTEYVLSTGELPSSGAELQSERDQLYIR